MKKSVSIVCSLVVASTGFVLVPLNVSAMELTNGSPYIVALSETTALSDLDKKADKVPLSDWAFPDVYEISDTLINQTGISYIGVKPDDPTQLHFKMSYRATATPAFIDWIYLRVDPELAPYIDEINIKNTVNVGAQVGYLRYFERVDSSSLGNVDTWGNQTGSPDVYANSDNEGSIYRVFLDKFFTRIPGMTPKTRGALSGNWGVFPSVPLEAERYEANIYVKLKEPVSTIQEKLGRKYYGVQLRLQGQNDEGKAVIAEESVNKNSVIDLEQEESTENNSNWLNSPSAHRITTTFEGKQMGADGEFSDVLSGTNKSLLRVQNTVMNNLLYGTALDLNRPVSFYVEIDPQILNLVSDDDYITVWQVYRESNISHHDGGNSNPPIMLKKDMFVNNRIKIEVNPEKAGTYENGTYYVNAVESFVNTVSSSPFVGANFVDVPIRVEPLYADEDKLVSASIRTWFTDLKNGEERVVRNSLASSYLSLFPSEINFYDYDTKDSEHPKKIRESTHLVSTFGQHLDGNEIGNLTAIDNYEYISSEPESFFITKKDGNVINLYYKRILTDAEKYEPTVEKEEVELGTAVNLTDNVSNLKDLPKGTTVTDVTPAETIDTNTAGKYEGKVEIKYPDNSKETVTVPVEVVDSRTDAEKYEPTVEKEKVELGTAVNLTDNVSNLKDLPKGTTVTDVTPAETIDINTAGKYEGKVEIKYPDGSKETVTVPVEVVDNSTEELSIKPTIDSSQIVPEIINKGDKSDLTDNVVGLPEGSKVEVVTPIDPEQTGDQTGVVKVTFPDGSSTTVEIPATVKDRVDWTEIQPIPTIDSSQIVPEVINKGDKSDLTDNVVGLPEGSKVEVVTPIDPEQTGDQTGVVKVTFPNGSSTTVEIPATVKDRVAWTEIQSIPTIDSSQIVPEIINKGDKSDLTDNVVGLPEGSKVEVVTPIDPEQTGDQTGVVKVTFPDGSSTTVEIPATVKDRVDWTEIQPIPTIDINQIVPEVINKGDKSDLTDNVVGLPEGSKVEEVTPIDPEQTGDQTGVVRVTFPDGSSTTVEIPATVKDRVDWTEIQPIPTIDSSQIVPEIINKGDKSDLTDNVVGLPEGSKVEVVTPIDPEQTGDQTGVVKVTFPDGSSTTVEVPATVKEITPKIEKDKHSSRIMPEIINKGDKSDLTDNVVGLPEGSKVEEVTPIDPEQTGDQTGVVRVTFPDGSSTTVEIPATVKDRVDWTEIQPIPTIDSSQIVPEIINKGDKSDLTDNVVGLPEGSKVEEVTPIDTEQTGDQTGVIKVTFPHGSSTTVEIPATVKEITLKVQKDKRSSLNRSQDIKSKAPKTGDNTNVRTLSLLLTGSFGILLSSLKKKKNTLLKKIKK